MNEEPKKELNKHNLKTWLELLQQESWQLELIISGFSIFLVASLWEPLGKFMNRLRVVGTSIGGETDFFIQLPGIVLVGAWLFLLINLVLHVLLRGLWISTIGLRYVSGEVDFDEFNFRPKFDQFLRKRIKSFDLYIERLERLCSVIFSFTFLIIFCLISFALYALFVGAVASIIDLLLEGKIADETRRIIKAVPLVIILITGLLYFIDFLTLGFFKKVKWLSKIYYPIYRFYSFITLANIYRPIYYNLIDNKFGRKVGRMIFPYILIILFITSIYADTHLFYPENVKIVTIDDDYYFDSRDEEDAVRTPTINSKYIKNGFIELFLPYIPIFDDDALELICPDFKPAKEVGIGQGMIRFGSNELNQEERQLNADTSFQCLQQLYILELNDSTFQAPQYQLRELAEYGERGLSTVLDVQLFGRGQHLLKVKKLRDRRIDGELQLDTTLVRSIPFWIE